MKYIIFFFCLLSFAPVLIHAQKYKHKTEAEIAALTPAQRVDEYINEEVYHLKYWETDNHIELIRKYVLLDGMKAVPRITEIIDAYDPTAFREGKGKLDARFGESYYLLHFIDYSSVRLRSTEEGRKAINAVERAIERLRKSKYVKDPNAKYGRNDIIKGAQIYLKDWIRVGIKDRDIQNTLRFIYKIRVSDEELAELSDFLAARYPDYPSWSNSKLTKDESELGPAGYPVQIGILQKPERYYEAYLEYKKSKS